MVTVQTPKRRKYAPIVDVWSIVHLLSGVLLAIIGISLFWILIIALHGVTGWPIVSFNEIDTSDDGETYESFVHFALRTPDGRYADARGIRTEAEIASNLLNSNARPLDNYTITDVTVRDIEYMANPEDEVTDMAIKFISSHRNLWK